MRWEEVNREEAEEEEEMAEVMILASIRNAPERVT